MNNQTNIEFEQLRYEVNEGFINKSEFLDTTVMKENLERLRLF